MRQSLKELKTMGLDSGDSVEKTVQRPVGWVIEGIILPRSRWFQIFFMFIPIWEDSHFD